MPKKKSDYLIIAFAAILLLVIIAVIILSFTTSLPAPQKTTQLLSPSPTQVPPPPVIGNNVPVIKHDDKADEKQLEKLKKRPVLSPEDKAVKENIIALINPTDPDKIIYQTNMYRIDYVEALDMIQTEILTTDIEQVKTDVVYWFRTNGMSEQGICNLPLDFYVSMDVMEQLRSTNYVFSPLAPGC